MGAVGPQTLAGLRRRSLSSFGIAHVLLLAVGSGHARAVVLVELQRALRSAFEAANGAHLVIPTEATPTAASRGRTATRRAL